MGTVTARVTDSSGNTAASVATYTTGGPTYTEFSDFATQSSGLYIPTSGITGVGQTTSIYRMKPLTSTKKATIDALAPGTTNQFYLVRGGGNDSAHISAGYNVSDLTLQGTDQNHLYGGYMVGYSTNATLKNVTINGIPGNASSPPGETFSLNLWHADNATLTNVFIDSHRASDNVSVASSLLGLNSVNGMTMNGGALTYSASGFGAALWRSTGVQTFNNVDFRFNRKAINIEQSIGGTVNFNGCNFGAGATTAPYVAQVSAITTSTVINFRDPIVTSWPLKVNAYSAAANNGLNVQKDSDIHCYIGGVEVTNDPTKFQITHL